MICSMPISSENFMISGVILLRIMAVEADEKYSWKHLSFNIDEKPFLGLILPQLSYNWIKGLSNLTPSTSISAIS